MKLCARYAATLLAVSMMTPAASAASDRPARGAGQDDRPNIVFIMSDDHAVQLLSA